ncbi:peptidase A24A domain protein [Rhodopirellula maiorica SM1]|uniref:Peptidase A24A domain protein n=1 Tax=Rhodopirellula maiorica SM1 TaxID=1265738 RepID=M5RNW9_9BACT|nr:prepilin peptidase [Rhodopirellula maiorica]EMI20995.1 peptidase A24A domain protein [Rhodopirellula maiorica SM1]
MAITLACIAAAYVFVMAWWQSRGTSHYRPADLYLTRLMDVAIAAWLFWIGSSIGSFLNVVAWRMPRNQSVNGRSYCPRCSTRLKARDNFPVFGWLALRGRCRTCRLPISPRYPIVEAAVGISITLVGIAEIYRLSLPYQDQHWHGGPLWIPIVDQAMLLTLLYHVIAIAMSWAIGLIRMDGHPLPRRLSGTAAVMLIGGMLIVPSVMTVPWQMQVSARWRGDGLYFDALMRVITALVAATFLGRCLARGLCIGADPKLDPLGKSTIRLVDLITMIAVPALVLGWQSLPAVLVVGACIALALGRVLPSSTDMLGRFAIAMPITLCLSILLWRPLHAAAFWPSDGSSPWVLLAAAALLLITPTWLRERQTLEGQSLPFDEPNDHDSAAADSTVSKN